jgi:hypothetical protein
MQHTHSEPCITHRSTCTRCSGAGQVLVTSQTCPGRPSGRRHRSVLSERHDASLYCYLKGKRSLLGQREKGTFLVCACDVSGLELEGMNEKILQGRYIGGCTADGMRWKRKGFNSGELHCCRTGRFNGASWHVNIFVVLTPGKAAKCLSCNEPTQLQAILEPDFDRPMARS